MANDKIDLRGNVKIFKELPTGRELIWENHNTILYRGRNVLVRSLLGDYVGLGGNNNWKLRMGCGWVGFLGETDPGIVALYSDADTDPTAESGPSLFERMGGDLANYPIPQVGHEETSTIADARFGESERINKLSINFSITGLSGVSAYPINEFGLEYQCEFGGGVNSILFAYEPTSNILLEATNTLTISWELIF